jgi:hypothetical protein
MIETTHTPSSLTFYKIAVKLVEFGDLVTLPHGNRSGIIGDRHASAQRFYLLLMQ